MSKYKKQLLEFIYFPPPTDLVKSFQKRINRAAANMKSKKIRCHNFSSDLISYFYFLFPIQECVLIRRVQKNTCQLQADLVY